MHRFLCLAIMTMLLLGSSGVVEASSSVAKVLVASTTDAAQTVALKAAREALGKSLKATVGKIN